MSRLLRLAVLLAMPVGAAAGLGVYTFLYARGYSYATNNPEACANCHVMQSHYNTWTRSSHHDVAVCNDCHTPHGLVGKYYTKALNGYHHSLAFTTGRYPDQIQITRRNQTVTEGACRHCHADVVRTIDAPSASSEPLSCTRCHSTVGHME